MARSEFSQRIVSALVMIPLAILSVWIGGVVFQLLLVVIGVLMAWELGRLVFGREASISHHALIGATLIILITQFFFHPFLTLTFLAIGIAIGLYLALMKDQAKGWTFFAYLFCTLPIIGLSFIRADEVNGLNCVIWLFATVWATDVCAYFTGRALGGPKLAPRYSPNKTWSGLLGGVLGASLAGFVTSYFLGLSMAPLMVLSAMLAVVAQGGDLLESHLKRRAGVKDSSNLIPGHGGVLDRLDGLIAVSFIGSLIGILRGGLDQTATGLMSW